MERGENRRQPRPVEKEQRKIAARRPIARGPLNPEASTRKRRRVSSVSRPRFISGGSVSEARLGVKCLQVVWSGTRKT